MKTSKRNGKKRKLPGNETETSAQTNYNLQGRIRAYQEDLNMLTRTRKRLEGENEQLRKNVEILSGEIELAMSVIKATRKQIEAMKKSQEQIRVIRSVLETIEKRLNYAGRYAEEEIENWLPF